MSPRSNWGRNACISAWRLASYPTCTADRIEGFYQQYIVPRKLWLDSEYMECATLLSDIRVLLATVLRVGEHITHEDLLNPNLPC